MYNVSIPSATVFSSTSEISRIKPLIAVITVLGLENNIVCDCIHIIKSSELHASFLCFPLMKMDIE